MYKIHLRFDISSFIGFLYILSYFTSLHLSIHATPIVVKKGKEEWAMSSFHRSLVAVSFPWRRFAAVRVLQWLSNRTTATLACDTITTIHLVRRERCRRICCSKIVSKWKVRRSPCRSIMERPYRRLKTYKRMLAQHPVTDPQIYLRLWRLPCEISAMKLTASTMCVGDHVHKFVTQSSPSANRDLIRVIFPTRVADWYFLKHVKACRFLI